MWLTILRQASGRLAKCQLDLAKIEICKAHPEFHSEKDCDRLFKNLEVIMNCFIHFEDLLGVCVLDLW
jgi:hypothetical protein